MKKTYTDPQIDIYRYDLYDVLTMSWKVEDDDNEVEGGSIF